MNTANKTKRAFQRPGILIVLIAGIVMMSTLLSSSSIHANPPHDAEQVGEGGGTVAAEKTDAELDQTPESTRIATKPLHDIQTDFAGGSFKLTAVNTDQKVEGDGGVSQYSPKFPDNPGAVQLIPVIPLEPFTHTNDSALPIKLTNMGVTAIGKYIFVLGGDQRDNPVTGGNPIRDVYIGEVDTDSGDKITWTPNPQCTEEPPPEPNRCLPVAVTNNDEEFLRDQTGEETVENAGVSLPAIASITTVGNSNSGYIYVIGGLVEPLEGSDDRYASAATLIARVENGEIVSWQTDTPLIEDPRASDMEEVTGWSYGLRSASAVIYENESNNRTFIYLIGGYHKGYELYPTLSDLSGRVFYAEIDRSNGQLYKPGTTDKGWEVMTDADGKPISIPPPEGSSFQPEDFGLRNGAAFVYDNALYVVGGERLIQDAAVTERYNLNMYRADIADDGKLTWQQEKVATLPQNPIYSMGSAQYQSNLYITGGVAAENNKLEENYATTDAAQKFLEGPYKDTEQWLPTSAEGTPLPYTRERHGMVVVPVNQGSVVAYVYVVAGQSSPVEKDELPEGGIDEDSDQGTDTVFFSKIDLENGEKIYPPSGNYVSEYIEIPAGERFTGIEWSAYLSRTEDIGTDIQMKYRLDVSAQKCERSDIFAEQAPGEEEGGWRVLTATDSLIDFYSVPGRNIGDMAQVDIDLLDNDDHPGACFQYEAVMTSKDTPSETPLLLNVYRRVKETVLPDLFPIVNMNVVNEAPEGENPDDYPRVVLNISIKNLNEIPEKTAPANFDGYNRIFNLDLFVFGPGQENVFDPMHKDIQLPFPALYTPTIESDLHYYSTMPKSQMAIAHEEILSPTTSWAKVTDPTKFTLDEELKQLSTSQAYTACVLVDSYIDNERDLQNWPDGYVFEARELNNVACDSTEAAEYEVWIKAEDSDQQITDQVREKEGDNTPPEEYLRGIFTIGLADDKEAKEDLEVHFKIKTEDDLGANENILLATYQDDYTLQDLENNNGFTSDITILNNKEGTVTIPEGENQVTFEVIPQDDDLLEGDEDVTYQLQAIPETYGLDTDYSQATVVILDNEHAIYLPIVNN
jgi:hypothetical protein